MNNKNQSIDIDNLLFLHHLVANF